MTRASEERTAELFKAMGDPHRLDILEILSTQGGHRPTTDCICACDVQAAVGLSQPSVSHHMKILVNAGLVHQEKHGRWMYYSLDNDGFQRAMDVLQHYLATADQASERPAVGA